MHLFSKLPKTAAHHNLAQDFECDVNLVDDLVAKSKQIIRYVSAGSCRPRLCFPRPEAGPKGLRCCQCLVVYELASISGR